MNCPDCTTPLSAGTYEGAPLNYCGKCSGNFVTIESLKAILESEVAAKSDAQRLGALASGGTAAIRGADGRPPRNCPACGTQMRRYIHAYDSGVWLDSCSDHGVWLDPGEIEQLKSLAEAIRRGGTMPATSGLHRKRRKEDEDPFGLRELDEWERRNQPRSVIDSVFSGFDLFY